MPTLIPDQYLPAAAAHVAAGAAASTAHGAAPKAVPAVGASSSAIPTRFTASPTAQKLTKGDRVKELVSRRAANTKVFELSNGQFEAELSADPVHYRDDDGTWRRIDTEVTGPVRDGYAFGNDRNRFSSSFGTRSDRLVRMDIGKRSLTMGVPGDQRELTPDVDDDVVTYRDVFGDGDLVYQVTPVGVKEEIVLDEAPDDAEFTFTVRMGGVVAREQDDGSIGFFHPSGNGEPVFEMPKPFMYDASDDTSPYGKTWSDKVTQTVRQQGSQIEITLTADEEWLADDDRVYPVVIDPTIIIEPTPTQGQDAMIRSAAPSTNYGESWQLGVGTDSTGVARSLLRFDMSWLPAGTPITSAELRIWYDQGYYTNANTVPISARRVTAAWDESTVTWSNFSGGSGEEVATQTKETFVNSAWHEFPVGDLVQQWVDGARANHGFMLRAADESVSGRGGAYYEAAEYAYNGGTANRPKLVVAYGQPGVVLDSITTLRATGAELSWPAYTSGDLVEYQVHRSVFQRFTPSAATLVAPLPPGTTSFTDTTAEPTPADHPDPFGNAYYYMVAVKTSDGTILPGNSRLARLPKAGHVSTFIHGDVADTTLVSAQPTTNFDVFDTQPWLGAGDNGGSYGRTRTVVKFDTLNDEIPSGATITAAELRLWKPITFGSGARFDLHALTRSFDETSATWNRASSGTAWTTPGGDYDPTVVAQVPTVVLDPKWHFWVVDDLVQQWVDTPGSNHGALIKIADEAAENQLTVFASNELESEPQLRPRLRVTYTEPTAESTYYAPDTSVRTETGEERTVQVTVTNTTDITWTASDYVLSYHWAAPDGTDATTTANRAETELPASLAPGESATIDATVISPALADESNKREAFTLQWDMRNRASGQWMSDLRNIPSLDQSAIVEDVTSNQLGLEKFYQYTGTGTGAGSTVLNNLHAGNSVFSFNPISNPSRGVSTFVRVSYNSLDTSASAMGFGWSLATSSLMRMGTPLDFHPRGQSWPTQITLTDGDGTAHLFRLNKHDSTNEADWDYDSPHGVNLYLQKTGSTDPTRAWVFTAPDGTEFYFDDDGYQTVLADRNGNELTFTYEQRKSNNKPIKFLRYLTDPHGRQTLTVDHYTKGENHTWIDADGDTQSGTNLTNPKIIDQVESVRDIYGRTVQFIYTEQGLLAQMIDAAGNSKARTFGFAYDMTQGNKNVKLVEITDPRGNTTDLAYFESTQDPKAKWMLKTLTDRAGGATEFAYVDPDGPQGGTVETTVTDALDHDTVYLMDGFGRPTSTTNAKGETTGLAWDDDHNVTELTEDDGAVTSWTYDPKTGYPTSITDAEANANGTASTTLGYQTRRNGYVADLVEKVSPEGRAWAFGYDTVGNLTSVTDPAGTATTTTGDYTTTYTYDDFGRLLTETDANENTTTYSSYHATGYPRIITDALTNTTTFAYGARGNVIAVTDARDVKSQYAYDIFGRQRTSKVPKDQTAGEFVFTPEPVYDPNDNVTEATAPNGAVWTYEYDAADRLTAEVAPKDTTGDPERRTSYGYDPVGNLLEVVEPKGTLTTGTAGDFTTTHGYDAIYQLTSVTNAEGHQITYEYDNVGNVVTVVDPRKNAGSDPAAFTAKYTYDRAHRVKTATDAADEVETTSYDLDGLVTDRRDKQGRITRWKYDPRGLVTEVSRPRELSGTIIVTTFTQFEYDEVGNRTRVVTPRSWWTPNVTDDFVHETVYDELNRPAEEILPYDPNDSVYNTPDKVQYEYDTVGNLTAVSAPPSDGQTARNTTSYTHFDNGWIKASTDPWDIVTTYDYNDLGQQTTRTLTSAGGSSSRTMSWDFFPDGKLASRSDDGVPAGLDVVLVDNTDYQNTSMEPTWPGASSPLGYIGHGFRWNEPGDGSKTFTWRLNIPSDGDYEVFVYYPAKDNRATDAPYTITHNGGDTTVDVNQQVNGGEWVSVGTYAFTDGGDHKIVLSDDANGRIAADAVKLVRDNSGDTEPQGKTFAHTYDPNGNLVEITDSSVDAEVDTYQVTYDGLNQVESVAEAAGASTVATTSFDYDENGNPVTRAHDEQHSTYGYDERDLLTEVSNGESAADPDPKVTSFTYNAMGWRATETKANGNMVTFGYFLDGLPRTQKETKADGTTVVADHTMSYDDNGNRTQDVVTTMDADDPSGSLEYTVDYDYDPRDRIVEVTKTNTATSATMSSESYVHDANNNVISQTIDGTATSFVYDRNRLMHATTGGVTAGYNYDPFGRIDTVTAAGQLLERYLYDGFDRVVEHRTPTEGGGTSLTSYTYDPLDRTVSKVDNAGGADEETTEFTYLGLSDQLISEHIDGALATSYQYSAWGQRLSQIKHDDVNGDEASFYGYNAHTDVETLTDETGTTLATYGYTAYGKNDEDLFTGIDTPDVSDPTSGEPYNIYRYNAKRFDTNSGTYDMGFRNYNPGLNRFLSRDMYNGALNDLNLGLNPFNANRYAFGGGNPITRIELDGHNHQQTPDGGRAPADTCINYQCGDASGLGSGTGATVTTDQGINWSDVGGLFKGLGEGALDTVTGAAQGVWNVGTCATQNYESCANLGAGVEAVVNDPSLLWQPIHDDWTAGNEGEAIGRGLFTGIEIIFGTKGIAAGTKGASAGTTANLARSAITGSKVVTGRFPRTAGADEILIRRSAAGGVTNYQVYGPDGLPLKRVDVTGRSHGGVDTPHVVEFERHISPYTGEVFVRPGSMVRPATPEELMGLD